MVNGLIICGIGSLPRDEEEYERETRSADSSPRKSRSSSKANKNPYSDRGLDKFTALLAEIEEKRRQIYSQVDPNEISLVRFVYTGDHDFKPIVVKTKNKVDHHEKNIVEENKNDHMTLSKLLSSSSMTQISKEEVKKDDNLCEKTKKKINIVFFKRLNLNQPMFYLAMMVMLILVILVLFGRSFAIMCTSIGWYAIPTITNHGNNNNNNNNVLNARTSFKKKDYGMKRRFSDKKIMYREGTTSFNHRKSF